VLSGRIVTEPAVRERLQALQDQGIATGMPAAGFAVGVTVGPAQLDAAVLQGRLLKNAMGGDLNAPVTPPEGSETATRARRHATDALNIGTRTVDAILGSGESVRSLGAGGFDAARKIREKQQEMTFLAREVGLTPAEMLLKGDRKDARVRRFLDAYDEVQTGLGTLSRRLAEPGAQKPMTDDEFQHYQDYWKQETTEFDKQNEAAVSKALGLSPATEPERKELADLLGTGDESIYRRRKLDLALEARGRILGMERREGVDIVGLRELTAPTSRLAAGDRAALTEDLRRAGALAEGIAPENLRAFLDEIAKPTAEAAPREIRLSGRLDLRNGDIVATGEPVTPAGATPAVAGDAGWA
jgi:hypothetical protein